MTRNDSVCEKIRNKDYSLFLTDRTFLKNGRLSHTFMDCIVLLEIVNAVRRGRDVVSSHVLVHFRETLFDVVLGAALSHCGEPKSLRGMVQLWERIKQHSVTLRTQRRNV